MKINKPEESIISIENGGLGGKTKFLTKIKMFFMKKSKLIK